MDRGEMQARVRAQLARDLCCDVADFDVQGIVLREAAEAPGRRPFPRGARHFEMVTMGGENVVISATADLLEQVRGMVAGASRDDVFAMPFVHGQAVYFLPGMGYAAWGDSGRKPSLPLPEGIALEWVERAGIPALYHLEGFHNALNHDVEHPRPDVLALVARAGDEVVGMAGASMDCADMWQVGIDVTPGWRGRGLAAALVARITAEVLARGKAPYYGTATSNLASQRVAYRAGYQVAWVCVYRGIFDGVVTRATG